MDDKKAENVRTGRVCECVFVCVGWGQIVEMRTDGFGVLTNTDQNGGLPHGEVLHMRCSLICVTRLSGVGG